MSIANHNMSVARRTWNKEGEYHVCGNGIINGAWMQSEMQVSYRQFGNFGRSYRPSIKRTRGH